MRFALSQRIKLLDCLIARLCVPRRNIDSGAVGHKTLRDHATNALGTAGDEDHFALKNK